MSARPQRAFLTAFKESMVLRLEVGEWLASGWRCRRGSDERQFLVGDEEVAYNPRKYVAEKSIFRTNDRNTRRIGVGPLGRTD